MEPANNLLAEINAIKESHEQLLNRFSKFVAQITAVSSEDGRFTNITITNNADNTISTKYLDKELKAFFSFSITKEGSRKGYVNCYINANFPNTEPSLIHSFSFTAQDVVDIPTNNTNVDDPYEIQHREDAVNILLHWVRLSVTESS